MKFEADSLRCKNITSKGGTPPTLTDGITSKEYELYNKNINEQLGNAS